MTHLRAIRFLTTTILSSAYALGCSSATTVDGDAGRPDAYCAPPPNITLGTGTANFESLSEGADIELIHGPQGGYHLWVTANFTLDTSPTGRFIDFVVRRQDGTMLGTTRIEMSEARLTRRTCGWFRGGDFVVLDAQPADVVNTNVEITVAILESDMSRVVSDQRHAHIVDVMP